MLKSFPSYKIEEIIGALKDGELVAVPSETVYGLAADALNAEAVLKIFQVKGRPFIDPLIVHVFSLDQVEQLAHVPAILYKLSEAFWPGPLTVVLPKKPIVPDIVTAGLNTIAIRMPKHPVFRRILKESLLTLAAPSANPFGYLSPTEAKHVKRTLGDKIKYIIDGGACPIGIESTILDISNPEHPIILRSGPVTVENLEKVLGAKPAKNTNGNEKGGAQKSPGLLETHYSPHTPLILFEKKITKDINKLYKYAVVYIKRPEAINDLDKNQIFWLSEEGDLKEVAKNLFGLLERLDVQGFNCIYIEKPEKIGIGLAINDRLSRAAHN